MGYVGNDLISIGCNVLNIGMELGEDFVCHGRVLINLVNSGEMEIAIKMLFGILGE